jgi:hypothetical protein
MIKEIVLTCLSLHTALHGCFMHGASLRKWGTWVVKFHNRFGFQFAFEFHRLRVDRASVAEKRMELLI